MRIQSYQLACSFLKNLLLYAHCTHFTLRIYVFDVISASICSLPVCSSTSQLKQVHRLRSWYSFPFESISTTFSASTYFRTQVRAFWFPKATVLAKIYTHYGAKTYVFPPLNVLCKHDARALRIPQTIRQARDQIPRKMLATWMIWIETLIAYQRKEVVHNFLVSRILTYQALWCMSSKPSDRDLKDMCEQCLDSLDPFLDLTIRADPLRLLWGNRIVT